MSLIQYLRRCFARSLASARRTPIVPEKPLLFLHIPKTAGSSINEFLVNRFAAGQIVSLYPSPQDLVPAMLPLQPVGCYAGHVRYDLTNYLPRNLTVFTVLRDPIDRALSAYYFYRRVPIEELNRGGPVIAHIQHMELGEFIRSFPKSARSTFGNYQTYFFSRPYTTDREEHDRPIDRTDLGRAKDHLARCIVGLTERLHEALMLLCHEYGWPFPDRVAEANRTHNRPRSVDREAQSWLEENTTLDAELVRFGRELFDQRWERLQQSGPTPPPPVAREYRLTFDQPIPGYGWHAREQSAYGYFCHTEPDAWLECPAPRGQRIRVEIDTIPFLPPQQRSPITLRANGTEVKLVERRSRSGVCYQGVVQVDAPQPTLRLDLHAERPVRPCDIIPGCADNRLLCLAVREVRLRAA